MRCPIQSCQASVRTCDDACHTCNTPLRAYALALHWPDICFNRALSLAQQGDYVAAEREAQACLALRPKDEEARLLHGKLRLAQGARREARSILIQLRDHARDPYIAAAARTCLAWMKDHPARKRRARTDQRLTG